MELTQEDRQELARLIIEGYTSGILDSEGEQGERYRISWELSTNKF